MPWLEDLKFPRGYQMGTHIDFCVLYDSILFRLCPCSNERLHFKWNGICVYPSIKVGFWIYDSIHDLLFVSLLCIVL